MAEYHRFGSRLSNEKVKSNEVFQVDRLSTCDRPSHCCRHLLSGTTQVPLGSCIDFTTRQQKPPEEIITKKAKVTIFTLSTPFLTAIVSFFKSVNHHRLDFLDEEIAERLKPAMSVWSLNWTEPVQEVGL
ncbi:hypothetical protein RUM44_008693 [Polyplax serrata]|uniref:Uncharacterized protein n=1 Tax=Polyplax serrata TaxID=468196 RepID=A0ABR1BD32_POLSC